MPRPTFTRRFPHYSLLTLSLLYLILSELEFRFVVSRGREQDIFLEKLTALCCYSRPSISPHSHPTCLMAPDLQWALGRRRARGLHGEPVRAGGDIPKSSSISVCHLPGFCGGWALPRAPNPGTGARNKGKAEQRDVELQRGYWWVTTAWALALINIFVNDLG